MQLTIVQSDKVCADFQGMEHRTKVERSIKYRKRGYGAIAVVVMMHRSPATLCIFAIYPIVIHMGRAFGIGFVLHFLHSVICARVGSFGGCWGPVLWRGIRLGLFCWHRLGILFDVIICGIDSCVVFGVVHIGFVLHITLRKIRAEVYASAPCRSR